MIRAVDRPLDIAEQSVDPGQSGRCAAALAAASDPRLVLAPGRHPMAPT